MRISAEARRIHKKALIIDGHNDHFMLKCERDQPFAFMKAHRRYHSDGVRLLKGGMTASFFMVDGHFSVRSMKMIELACREVERNPEKLMLATNVADIMRAKRTGRLAVMMSWESCTAMQEQIEVLQLAHRLGVRCMTVTHGEGGCKYALQRSRSPFKMMLPRDRRSHARRLKGLTCFGKQAVAEMNRLGILVDVAHANDRTQEEMFELSSAPVVSTHGGVYALAHHSRCSTDDQIRAIAATGGLLSIAFYPGFLNGKGRAPTVDAVVDQILYVAELVGFEHVGIGTDYDGLPPGQTPVIPTADKLPLLTEAMLRRGMTESDILKVLGGNYMRVLKQVWK